MAVLPVQIARATARHALICREVIVRSAIVPERTPALKGVFAILSGMQGTIAFRSVTVPRSVDRMKAISVTKTVPVGRVLLETAAAILGLEMAVVGMAIVR